MRREQRRASSVTTTLGMALFALAGCGGDGASQLPPDRVSLEDGELQGDEMGGAIRFLKIPFAKPPVGELRWKAPMPNEPWEGVRHETEFAEPCPQAPSEQAPDGSTNEDCLYLNVWRPAERVSDAPVMVWIHGGGNRSGAASDILPTTEQRWYDGQVFAERHGVVVVTINYRLGAFGFFAHPALAEEGSAQGNQGLLDQQRALEWVQQNIEAFGGDPENVTIFGESAGSADVCLHMVSPDSRGLFHRAISQSGGCTMRSRAPENLEQKLVDYAADKGCEGDDVLDCLRDKEVKELISFEETMRGGGEFGGEDLFEIVVDGEDGFLPAPPAELFEQGDIAQVPYILGSNTEEGQLYFFSATDLPSNDEEYLARLEDTYGDFADRVAEMYPASRFDGDYRKALARARGDSGLVCGTHDTARRAADAGLDVYMYNFNIPWSIAPDALGPTHAAEISHVFGNPYVNDAESETGLDPEVSQEVSDAMNAYWASFAETGDPNHEGAPKEWPQFTPENDVRIQFDPDYEILEDFRSEECEMWREYAQSQSEG